MTRKFPLFALPLALACSSEPPVTLDDIDMSGKADNVNELYSQELSGGYLIEAHGGVAHDLWNVMNGAGGFVAKRKGGLDYLYGADVVCASNGSTQACNIYSEQAYASDDYLLTLHGERFDSAASEIFGAIARSQGIAPVSVTAVSSERFHCAKNQTEVWCGISSAVQGPRLELSFAGLEPLGPDYVYEGWLITSDGPVTSGRFNIAEDGETHTFAVAQDIADDSTLFVLTIEPAVGDDPAPSDTHVLAGAFDNGEAMLALEHPAAFGTDFADADGSYILQTPSTASIPGDYAQGIWFVNPGAGAASLMLPALPKGWAYEGWVVDGNGPVSTGRFTDAGMADSDQGGPSAGPDGTPSFPGQDFISPARNLVGNRVVISVEPDPDDSPAPFAIKPLVDMNVEDVGPGVLQSMVNNAAQSPSGVATLR